MPEEARAHNELFEKVGNLMATAQATRDSVALLRSETSQRLDSISIAINAHMDGSDKAIKVISDRVTALENDRRMVFSIGAAIAFIFSIFGGWIWDTIKHFLHWG